MDERKILLSLPPKEALGRYVRLLREYRTDAVFEVYCHGRYNANRSSDYHYASFTMMCCTRTRETTSFNRNKKRHFSIG